MTESMAVKLGDPTAVYNTDWENEGVSFWQSVFIAPEIDPNLTLEGIPLKDIAKEVSSPDSDIQVFSYEDVLLAFGLEEDVYTPDQHEQLLTQLAFAPHDEFFLTDSLPEKITQRRLMQKNDLSPGLLCTVAPSGFPTQEPAVGLALGNIATRDAGQAVAVDESNTSLMLYAFGKDGPSMDPQKYAEQSLDFMIAVVSDVDAGRADDMMQTLVKAGCGDLHRDSECIHESSKIGQGKYEEFIKKPECQHFEEDLVCVHKTLGQMVMDMGLQVLRQGINEYRRQNKGNTYTNKDRAILLKEAIATASAASGDFFNDPVHDILIVGPGLEEIHPELGVSVPRQSYEPFAVAEVAVKYGQADATDLRVDLVDINPSVVAYFSELIATGNNGVAHPVWWSEEPTAVSPLTISQFHVSEGDIISDALAPEEKYNWIVMMNTFMYFNDTEKLLAAENIARMLKPGGMFFTDLDPAFLPTHTPDTCKASSASALQSKRVVGHDDIPYPVVIYRKPLD